ncbi:hypothetical protein C7447_101474 [Tenacibaculum adriaticum]|uniref:MG2 domain-containing protein n=1 Tax=Tenacibaculum adriaticum TaxID=413713 RepID=A0A5S5DZ85_9FLAO|nr:hypothetical protein [Tenacibaculum adriaticum]TYP99869.1 hypothetical protein C7447_101474 [Tenacibaculum adriaticum]
MKKSLIILFIIHCNLNAQSSFIDSVIKPLQKEPLFSEKVYIHTNKEIYNSDDIIWFKAYVVGNKNKPSQHTTLLYVNLLNEKGDLIISKNVLINKGIGVNQIQLPSTKKGAKYYIQAYTNYMKNFGGDNYFFKKITAKGNTKINKPFKNKYDIQLFPEGGYLLEGFKNTIGIKVTKNGYGVDYSAKIITLNKQEVTKFKNEHKGMSKTSFFYKKGQNYSASVILKDTVINIEVPLAKKEGVLLNLTKNKDSIKIELKGQFIKTNYDNNYIVLFHQKNQLIDYFQLPKFERREVKTLHIDKRIFLNGVNTVTLFKNNEPISERKFFIEKSNKESAIKLEKISEEIDSITYGLTIYDTNKELLNVNASVSVLLDKYYKFNPEVNIVNAFNLSPFVKGYIEEPSHYFNQKNAKRKEHLDLLLLTQGWSKYDLTKMISDLNPKYKYSFELGFNLKGSLSPVLTNELALISSKEKLIDKVSLIGNNDFNFKKLLIYKGDTVKVSFIKNNEALSPKKIKMDTVRNFFNPKVKHLSEYTHHSDLDENYFINSDIIKLDEVEVKGKKRSEKYLKKKKFVKKYKSIVWDIGKYYPLKISQNYKEEKINLMTFLFNEEGVIIKKSKGPLNYLSVGVNKLAFLFIDGKGIEPNELSNVFLRMNEVKDIAIQPKGRGNKKIQVFTTENYKKNIENLFKQFIIKNGYDRAKKYYSPTLNPENFNEIQELDWKPVLRANKSEEKITFKLKKYEYLNQKNIVFYIQGISNKGNLINQIIKNNN